MSKVIRVTLLNGEARVQELPPGMELPQWWRMVQADHAVIGNAWCARFDAISHVDVVSDGSRAEIKERTGAADTVSGLTSVLSTGAWKSPHEA